MRAIVGLVLVTLAAAGCGGGQSRPDAFTPLWSPDGRTIAYIVDPTPAEGCPYGSCSVRLELWLMRPDGTGAHRLARATNAAWAPDGRTLALQRADGHIWTIRADGTQLRRVTAHSRWDATYRNDAEPAWSPDGRQLVFTTWSAGRGPLDVTSRLYVVGADGTGQRKLTGLDVYEAAWSPRGATVAFTSFERLNAVGGDGRGLRVLFRSRSIGSFAWSPDGRRIALTVGAHVAVVDPAGRVLLRPMSRIPGAAEFEGETSVTWSPDGRTLALADATGDELGIHLLDATGKNWRQITDGGGEPAWSPDGRQILYVADGDIYAIDADGGARRNLSAQTR